MELKRCTNCANGAWTGSESVLPEVCLNCNFRSDGSPSEWKPKVATNAYRIRAMSDEELCEFLSQYVFHKMCDEGCDACTYSGDCDKRLLEWLKQPAEGE